MLTLGINAAYHDSSACLVRDGEVIAAAEEERFTGIKHAKRPVPFSTWELPFHAIDYCLGEAGARLVELDHVAYAYDPYHLLGGRERHSKHASIALPMETSTQPAGEWLSPWDPLFISSIVHAPRQLVDGAPHHLRRRFAGARFDGPYRWHFVEHSCARSQCISGCPLRLLRGADHGRPRRSGHHELRRYHGGAYERLGQVELPHSLGLLYEDVTTHLGFLHSSDEYKVMALAAFGSPSFLPQFRDIVRAKGDGRYTIERGDLARRFGPARERGAPLEQRHYDLAASLQKSLEETVIALSRWLREASGERRLAMAGGVALNCVMNSRLRDSGLFDSVWAQPAAGDAGTALGAALWIDAQHSGQARSWSMNHAYLGPAYSDEEIERLLSWSKLSYRRLNDVAEETADALARNQIIGWFQGRMEFGPRALGGRSILASPIHPNMQAQLNGLKDREDFRPVAPVVTEDAFGEWFSPAQANDGRAPFMVFIHDLLPDKANRIPAVRHVDGTARVQTISRDHNPRYYDLLRAFERRTGVPVLVNTSFNTRGLPVVCTPRDALESFFSTPLDALVIGAFLVEKRGP
jgi:carbamoyltransferase